MLANVGTFYKDVISYASFYPNICGREDLDKDPSSVLRETIALFQTRQRGKQRVLSPRYVKEAMGEVSVRFADSDQQVRMEEEVCTGRGERGMKRC